MASFNLCHSTLRVCVDAAESGRISGRVLSRLFSAPLSFADMGDLVLRVDEILDAQNFPQAFQRARTFAPHPASVTLAASGPDTGLPPETVNAAAGAVTTFQLCIISRRSSSWQGFVDWLDGSSRRRFSSALELIRIADAHFGGEK